MRVPALPAHDQQLYYKSWTQQETSVCVCLPSSAVEVTPDYLSSSHQSPVTSSSAALTLTGSAIKCGCAVGNICGPSVCSLEFRLDVIVSSCPSPRTERREKTRKRNFTLSVCTFGRGGGVTSGVADLIEWCWKGKGSGFGDLEVVRILFSY